MKTKLLFSFVEMFLAIKTNKDGIRNLMFALDETFKTAHKAKPSSHWNIFQKSVGRKNFPATHGCLMKQHEGKKD